VTFQFSGDGEEAKKRGIPDRKKCKKGGARVVFLPVYCSFYLAYMRNCVSVYRVFGAYYRHIVHDFAGLLSFVDSAT
jgi:hypothetical protein